MVKKFTSGPIIKSALKSVKKNIAFFTLVSFTFLLAIMLLGGAFVFLSSESNVFLISFILLIFLLYAKLTILVHRAVILNEIKFMGIFKWTFNDLKFILWVLIYIIAFIGPIFLYIYLFLNNKPDSSLILFFVFMISLSILFSRLSLVFPSVAIGNDISPIEAWEKSKWHVENLFFLIILLPYITNLIFKIVPEGNIVFDIIMIYISILVVIIEIAILSHCYEALFGKDNSESIDKNI